MFSNQHSVRLNYLQGETLANKFCHYKVQHDIVLLEVSVNTGAIVNLNLQKSSLWIDKFGLIGNIHTHVHVHFQR